MSANKVSPKTILLIALAGIVFIVAMFYVISNSRRSRAALGPDGIQIVVTPATGTFAPNADQIITVKLQPVTATNKMVGYDLTFNATGNLQFVAASKPVNFDDELWHTITPTQIRLSRIVGPTAAEQQIAEFTITVKGTGNGAGGFSLDASKAEVVGTLAKTNFDIDTVAIGGNYTFGTGGGQPTTPPGNPTTPPGNPTTPPGNPTAVPTNPPGGGGSTTLNMKIKFQGIPTKPTNANAETVQVRLFKEGDQAPINGSGQFTPDASGIYNGTVTLNASPGANYTLYVKGPRHLQKKICANSPLETSVGTYRCGRGQVNITSGTNNIDLSKILVLVGDLPQQDGIVDAYDTSFIRQSFGSTDPSKLAIGDLNRDGIVDTQDMSLIIQSLNVKYDEE